MTTFQARLSPEGGRSSHSASWVPLTLASSQTPCGPITMSVSPKSMSGNAAEQAHVEARRPLVALPAVAGLDELVDAVLGERRDEAGKIAGVLCLRVPLPELPDLVVLGRVGVAPDQLEHVVGHEPTLVELAGRECAPEGWSRTNPLTGCEAESLEPSGT